MCYPYLYYQKYVMKQYAICSLFFGGRGRDRTRNLFRARELLSQLSYAPYLITAVTNPVVNPETNPAPNHFIFAQIPTSFCFFNSVCKEPTSDLHTLF